MMTAAQIAEKKGLDPAKVTNAMTKIIKEGLVDYVKPDGIRTYFWTGQGTTELRTKDADLSKKSAAATRPARKPKSQRGAAKVQRKTAKKTARSATRKPARNIPQVIPAPLPAPAPTNFRCGIFSDGALRLDGRLSDRPGWRSHQRRSDHHPNRILAQASRAGACVMEVTREELLFTAALLRAQVKRLRTAARPAARQVFGKAYFQCLEDAEDLEHRAEQMEKEAEGLHGNNPGN
jgi:hypothetical protein